MARWIGRLGALGALAWAGCFGNDGSGEADVSPEAGVRSADGGTSDRGGTRNGSGTVSFGVDANMGPPVAGGSPAPRPDAGSVPRCTPGQSAACVCSDGRAGAQVCAPDGTFEACTCNGDPPTTGTACVPGEQSVPGMDGDPCPQLGTSCAASGGVALASCAPDGSWPAVGACMCVAPKGDACTVVGTAGSCSCADGSGTRMCQPDLSWSDCTCLDAGTSSSGTATACLTGADCPGEVCCNMIGSPGFCALVPGIGLCICRPEGSQCAGVIEP